MVELQQSGDGDATVVVRPNASLSWAAIRRVMLFLTAAIAAVAVYFASQRRLARAALRGARGAGGVHRLLPQCAPGGDTRGPAARRTRPGRQPRSPAPHGGRPPAALLDARGAGPRPARLAPEPPLPRKPRPPRPDRLRSHRGRAAAARRLAAAAPRARAGLPPRRARAGSRTGSIPSPPTSTETTHAWIETRPPACRPAGVGPRGPRRAGRELPAPGVDGRAADIRRAHGDDGDRHRAARAGLRLRHLLADPPPQEPRLSRRPALPRDLVRQLVVGDRAGAGAGRRPHDRRLRAEDARGDLDRARRTSS